MFGLFQRCQVNISMEQPNGQTQYMRPPIDLNELIIQQKSAETMHIFNAIKNRTKMSVLLDASGGRGIDTPVKPLNIPGLKVGYAGGMNHDNVGDKLYQLLRDAEGDFWIDMESGVRTDDRFDLNKVYKVLQVCQEILKEV
jgi:phosphoribosylanthranilate isomerase